MNDEENISMAYVWFGVVSFALSVFFGAFLANVAKYRWRNRELTATFSSLAIVCTVAFAAWVWFYSDL